MKKAILLIFTVFSIQLQAQSKNTNNTDSLQNNQTSKWNFGLELDALPYATGGYFGAVWAGKNKWRGRALFADVNKPDFTTKDGFTNHHIKAYAVILDRFLKDNWKGWWIGGGPVYWKSNIQSDSSNATKDFNNFLLNGSLGYNFTIYKNIYISPWAGLSLKVSGTDEFTLDSKEYNLPLLNPEASVKFGISF
ncbi:hypothetical protein CLU83_0220 [Flavobacterium sp. 1]|uniref:hypothetical protein n=1 Tax=Flavobacterium sp. 1 TaxID=2035200 RepID=UPI000C24976E|nr:hypothetical protein [Flavobacterium sp. 1]PJJ07078.1 hypothetical protein CLU83_0220 [Flavobacterium sp. 1]